MFIYALPKIGHANIHPIKLAGISDSTKTSRGSPIHVRGSYLRLCLIMMARIIIIMAMIAIIAASP